MLHAHNVSCTCEVSGLLHKIQKKTGKLSAKAPPFIKPGMSAVVRIAMKSFIPLENYDNMPQMGRFTLRDEGRTIAIGKVLEVDTTKFGGFMQDYLDNKNKKKEKKKKG